MTAHVLLVEDDDITLHLLAQVLADAGFDVTPAHDGSAAIALLDRIAVDVVVTDIWMREVDGIEVMHAARGRPDPPEVILLTGYGSLDTAVAGLRAGAFNYLAKPCDSVELISCVTRAAQRRTTARRRGEAIRTLMNDLSEPTDDLLPAVKPPNPRPTDLHQSAPLLPTASAPAERFLRVGLLRLDTFRHAATFDGQLLHLTPTEFTLLRVLAEEPGRVRTFVEIVQRTHSYTVDDDEAQMLLRGHVRNLRRKIPPDYLSNVRGVGYMLSETSANQS
jgi:DNA-binding response OmpR family regulator